MTLMLASNISTNAARARQGRSRCVFAPRAGERGLTLVEVTITLAMLMLLIVSAIGAITLLDRASRHQGQDTTALEIAQGKMEEFLGTQYNPPLPPFTSGDYFTTNTAVIAMDKSGTTNVVTGVVLSEVEPVANGHLVTVTVTFTNYGRPMSAQLQTVINKHSGGQP
jgi:Tfp pilus assembly protein PilE